MYEANGVNELLRLWHFVSEFLHQLEREDTARTHCKNTLYFWLSGSGHQKGPPPPLSGMSPKNCAGCRNHKTILPWNQNLNSKSNQICQKGKGLTFLNHVQSCEWNDKSLNRERESRTRIGSDATFFWDSLSNLDIDDNFRISHNLGLVLAANISTALAIQPDRGREIEIILWFF